MKSKLEIKKKTNLKGNDGYKVFSVRIKEETLAQIENISMQTNRSRNELINIILEYGIENCEIKD